MVLTEEEKARRLEAKKAAKLAKALVKQAKTLQPPGVWANGVKVSGGCTTASSLILDKALSKASKGAIGRVSANYKNDAFKQAVGQVKPTGNEEWKLAASLYQLLSGITTSGIRGT